MVADSLGARAVRVAGAVVTSTDHRSGLTGLLLHLTQVLVGHAVGSTDGADDGLTHVGTDTRADALLGRGALLAIAAAEQVARMVVCNVKLGIFKTVVDECQVVGPVQGP